MSAEKRSCSRSQKKLQEMMKLVLQLEQGGDLASLLESETRELNRIVVRRTRRGK